MIVAQTARAGTKPSVLSDGKKSARLRGRRSGKKSTFNSSIMSQEDIPLFCEFEGDRSVVQSASIVGVD